MTPKFLPTQSLPSNKGSVRPIHRVNVNNMADAFPLLTSCLLTGRKTSVRKNEETVIELQAGEQASWCTLLR